MAFCKRDFLTNTLHITFSPAHHFLTNGNHTSLSHQHKSHVPFSPTRHMSLSHQHKSHVTFSLAHVPFLPTRHTSLSHQHTSHVPFLPTHVTHHVLTNTRPFLINTRFLTYLHNPPCIYYICMHQVIIFIIKDLELLTCLSGQLY